MINGQRSNKLLIFQSYIFNLREKRGETTIWRCRDRNCRAQCIINSDESILLKTPHNHPELTLDTINSLKVKARIKVGAKSSGDRTLNVVMNELKDASIGVIQNLPRERSLNRIVQRERLAELPDFIHYSRNT